MLHLLQRTISPVVKLQDAMKDWYEISCALREASRTRQLRIEQITGV